MAAVARRERRQMPEAAAEEEAGSRRGTMETRRVIAVLDETIARAEHISLLPHVVANLRDLARALGPALSRALAEHDALCRAGGPGRSLQSSGRRITRLLQAQPGAAQAVRDKVYARDLTDELFVQGLTEFRGFLLERLLTSPREEEARARLAADVALRDQHNAETVAALRADLAAALHSRDEEIYKKNAVIRDLKTHLHHLAKFSENHILRSRQEAEKQQKGELRTSQAKRARLQQDIQQLRAQLNALVTENRESELALRKKKYKVEMEIENWIQKYDADMGEKQMEYEEVDAIYTEEKAQLAQLKEIYAVLEQEYSQIKEERRIAQEKKERAERELAIMIRAATRIQAFWKGYLVRSLLKSKKKKKGKGKKAKVKK
ncbi:PREDICTED: IQ domain-containing protein D [Crocodylus porosus]|uniref:Dynein regulatory complex protein 10 n=1 Tax=Crocodylus porosus TaxID=8502 RepID=A0A7M4FV63_CROPO|nr:PREDICTED: IQ domain-containing protein D [Crocodylus porosus]